ncbi:uncharacterized protein LOC136039797 [Artemia franciscana]|uniref:uncharacterized protein LOC136039797 n=1 Tax=Artemia franciscana TaxID=6661 RepID=UPI0032DAF45D
MGYLLSYVSCGWNDEIEDLGDDYIPNPTVFFLRYLQMPDNPLGIVDIDGACTVMLALLDRLAATHLPPWEARLKDKGLLPKTVRQWTHPDFVLIREATFLEV